MFWFSNSNSWCKVLLQCYHLFQTWNSVSLLHWCWKIYNYFDWVRFSEIVDVKESWNLVAKVTKACFKSSWWQCETVYIFKQLCKKSLQTGIQVATCKAYLFIFFFAFLKNSWIYFFLWKIWIKNNFINTSIFLFLIRYT